MIKKPDIANIKNIIALEANSTRMCVYCVYKKRKISSLDAVAIYVDFISANQILA